MQEQEKQTAKGRDLYEWVQSLVGSVLVVVAIFTFVIRMMGVDGHSMLNTLQHGDRLLVVNSMLYHDYKYGDIVILRKNGVFWSTVVNWKQFGAECVIVSRLGAMPDCPAARGSVAGQIAKICCQIESS